MLSSVALGCWLMLMLIFLSLSLIIVAVFVVLFAVGLILMMASLAVVVIVARSDTYFFDILPPVALYRCRCPAQNIGG